MAAVVWRQPLWVIDLDMAGAADAILGVCERQRGSRKNCGALRKWRRSCLRRWNSSPRKKESGGYRRYTRLRSIVEKSPSYRPLARGLADAGLTQGLGVSARILSLFEAKQILPQFFNFPSFFFGLLLGCGLLLAAPYLLNFVRFFCFVVVHYGHTPRVNRSPL